MVFNVLRGPLSRKAGMAQAGLQVLANLAANDGNKRLLGTLGACEGERLSAFSIDLLIDLLSDLCISVG